MPSSGGEEPARLRGLSPPAEGAALSGGELPLPPRGSALLKSAAAAIGSTQSWDKRCTGCDSLQQTCLHSCTPSLHPSTNSLPDILRNVDVELRQSVRAEGRR